MWFLFINFSVQFECTLAVFEAPTWVRLTWAIRKHTQTANVFLCGLQTFRFMIYWNVTPYHAFVNLYKDCHSVRVNFSISKCWCAHPNYRRWAEHMCHVNSSTAIRLNLCETCKAFLFRSAMCFLEKCNLCCNFFCCYAMPSMAANREKKNLEPVIKRILQTFYQS